jgi:hypothetical protein
MRMSEMRAMITAIAMPAAETATRLMAAGVPRPAKRWRITVRIRS